MSASPAGPAPPRTGPPGLAPLCWREGGPDPPQLPVEEAGMGRPSPPSPSEGQEVGDYRSLCWFGRGLCDGWSNSVVTPVG